MLKIKIKDLTFDCVIGILPFERKKTQRVIVNISFKYDFNPLDDNFIDYSEISSFVENIMKKKKFLLIEDALNFLYNKLNSNYNIKKLKLKISKPDIMPNCVVSVSTTK
ncbi:MAG: dihydroneopterin aldolase [Campylobacterota bacterium]|nr:dihydroneopterin aldolase [Campylobacterota bacterium]